jgi:transposase
MTAQSTFNKVENEQQFNNKMIDDAGTKTIILDPNKSIEEQIKNINFDMLSVDTSKLDTQVKMKQQRAPKRKFSNTYKLQILNLLDACKTGEERSILLRKEGLYYARVSTWKKQFQNRKFVENKTQKSVLLTQQLSREVTSLKKKLSQAEAVIDLQKKVSELLLTNVLNYDGSEMSS